MKTIIRVSVAFFFAMGFVTIASAKQGQHREGQYYDFELPETLEAGSYSSSYFTNGGATTTNGCTANGANCRKTESGSIASCELGYDTEGMMMFETCTDDSQSGCDCVTDED